MRIVLLSLLITTTSVANAASPECGNHPVITITKTDGTAIGIVISDEQWKKAPRWKVEAGEPPLSLSKAISIAKAWAKKTYTRYDDVTIEGVDLNAHGCATTRDQWYYLVHFSPIMDGQRLFGGSYIAAVLMDGTVVGPIPVKRDF